MNLHLASDPSEGAEKTSKRELKCVDVMQAAKIVALFYAFISLTIFVFGLIAVAISGEQAVEGGGQLTLMLLLYPVLGFFFGAIAAALYNAIAKRFGGFRYVVEDL